MGISATDINTEITRRIDDLTRRPDRLEDSLPPIASRTVGLSRATVHRVNSTAANVANDVGQQLGRLTTTARSGVAPTVGQGRSAIERTSTTARRTSKETTSQARAQGMRTAEAAERSATELLEDAARTIEPGELRESLEDRTKEELYEQARELDIDGRSSMNKGELVRAIRAA